jgi:hypothetical protein
MEGLGLSGEADCARSGTVQVEGQEHRLFKSVGMNDEIYHPSPQLKPAHTITAPCHIHPLKSIHSSILPQWLAAANASLDTLPPERAIPAKWGPLAAESKPKSFTVRQESRLPLPV